MSEDQGVPLSAPPTEGQFVSHEGKIWQTIREGRAFILVPPNARTSTDPKASKVMPQSNGRGSDVAQTVFYNPIQQFNRDLSVLAIKTFGEDFCESKRVRSEQNRARGEEKRERKRRRVVDEEDHVDGETEKKIAKTENGAADAEINETQADSAQAADEVNAEPETKRPSFKILDALSATGLRALRYASEIPCATAITANDMDVKAVRSIKTNVLHNQLNNIITPKTGNAIGFMYSVAYPVQDAVSTGKFEVIDLDPYGTAAPFIDAALQALSDGGLLCVTCTDSGVFASCGYAEKTFSSYGGMPVKGPHSHEAGLRIILQSVAATAGRYGLSIEPLLSLSIDFYVRMFIRVRRRPVDVKFLAGKTMIVYECDAGCGSWTIQHFGRNHQQESKNKTVWWKHTIAQAPTANRLCEHCGSKMHIAGPMWAGPIHNASFLHKVLKQATDADRSIYHTIPRIEGMLDTALNELCVIDNADQYWPAVKGGSAAKQIINTPPEAIDLHPFFFIPSALAKVLHCQAPPESAIKGALRYAGYRATRSHCKPGSIKTDAPWSAIWKIMRVWATQKAPIKEGSLTRNHAGWKIMYGDDSEVEQIPNSVDNTKSAQQPEANEESSPEAVVHCNDTAAPRAKSRPIDARKFSVVFDEVLGKDNGRKMVRYQANPRENWGPMAKAKKPS